MHILHTPAEMSAWAHGKNIGLVPTMGNLHAGHLSLVEKIKPLVDHVVVSIFVNPTQFGPNEDFAQYPRTLEQDCELLKTVGTDVVFAPQDQDMITETFIKVSGLSDILCGASRPGHFQGVATIVCKLFQIVQPRVAIFGEKDFQQLQVIRRMVADLHLPVTILGAPIVREKNGLAMSSRNQYLSEQEREQAATLYQTLKDLVKHVSESRDYSAQSEHATQQLNAAGFKTDYLTIRRQHDLLVPTAQDKHLIVLAAAFLGKTRLIDNIAFEVS